MELVAAELVAALELAELVPLLPVLPPTWNVVLTIGQEPLVVHDLK